MPNPSSDFLKFANTPFESWILPIIPAKATLKPREDGKPGIAPERLGKIPGKYVARAGAWVGFKWQDHRTTKDDLKQWQGWQTPDVPIAIGMRTAEFPVVDIDSDAPEIVEAIHSLATKHLGWSPVRCREESPRRVLCYKWTPGPKRDRAPVRKMRFAFTDNADEIHVVEILGLGQQVVIEGPHAKGKMHYWLDQKGLTESHGELVDIGAAQASEFLTAVREWAEEQGFTPVKLSLPTSSNRAAAVKIDIMSPHVAGDMKLLARCVDAIDINDPRLADYDTWCALFRAIKAACGGDQAFYAEHVWPWLRENPENKEEEMEATWNSFHDSQLGADVVYGCAAQFGFTEGVGAMAERIFGAQPEADRHETANTAVGTEDASGSRSVVSSGPTPFNDTHRALAQEFIRQHGTHWRFNVDAKRWLSYAEGIWRPDDSVAHVITERAYVISQQILRSVQGASGVQRSRALENEGTIRSVQRMLQTNPAMMVNDSDFDAVPYLLNTPECVIDLRDRSRLLHAPEQLMRCMTSVSPDVLALGNCEAHAPLFFSILRNVAAGRPWVIPAIQCWFAYVLCGEVRHHGLMFIQGPPGVGKTQIFQVLFEIMHTYAALLSESFLSKNGGETKRFDMADIIAKRMLFFDETQLGMVWDETRMSAVAAGKMLSAELKFGRRVQFHNTGKMCIAGNHLPGFVSGEAGGLTSRLLLLEAQGVSMRGSPAEIVNIATRIVQEEGPAILMWALEASVEDYASQHGAFYRSRVKEMQVSAVEYAKEDNPYRQWIAEAGMRTDAAADIDLCDALDRFNEFLAKRGVRRAPITWSAFKKQLIVILPHITFGTRTTRPHPSRSYIRGFGLPQGATDASGNVFLFPTTKPSITTQAEEK